MKDFRRKLLFALPVLALMVWAGSVDAHETPCLAQPPGAAAQAGEREMRVSRILGMKVEDRSGARIGEVQDLVIDTDESAVAYGVLSRDEANFVAIPAGRIRGHVEGGRVRLDLTKADVVAMPRVDSFADRREG